jgi:hypothetical protein
MTSASRHRRRQKRQIRRPVVPSEGRASEAVTVAWTVTVMSLVICELMALAAVVVLRFRPAAETVRTLIGLAHFCAVVLAIVSLSLLPVVYRIRRARPPRAFVAFALAAAAVPFVVAIWRGLG